MDRGRTLLLFGVEVCKLPDPEPNSKLSARLAAEIAMKGPDENVDVVIGVTPADNVSEPADDSRAAAIAALREAFESTANQVSAHVQSIGGQVLSSAWVNSTLRGRVRVSMLDELANDRLVDIVDIQPPLELDSE